MLDSLRFFSPAWLFIASTIVLRAKLFSLPGNASLFVPYSCPVSMAFFLYLILAYDHVLRLIVCRNLICNSVHILPIVRSLSQGLPLKKPTELNMNSSSALSYCACTWLEWCNTWTKYVTLGRNDTFHIWIRVTVVAVLQWMPVFFSNISFTVTFHNFSLSLCRPVHWQPLVTQKHSTWS